ncbi:hypothetical protein ACC761_30565 [Rhizobium ruizarguesonis]|nr:hypothetical protein [Rhizobium ruizarguesonis]
MSIINTRSLYEGAAATVVDKTSNLHVPSDYRASYQVVVAGQ